MDILSIITILVLLSTAFSYLNKKFMRLAGTIGVMAVSLVISILTLVGGKSNTGIGATISTMANRSNFLKVHVNVMLGFYFLAMYARSDYRVVKDTIFHPFMTEAFNNL